MRRFVFVFLGLVSTAVFAEIGPNTIIDEVPGDTTLSNLVAASGATPANYATVSSAAMTALQPNATNGLATTSGVATAIASVPKWNSASNTADNVVRRDPTMDKVTIAQIIATDLSVSRSASVNNISVSREVTISGGGIPGRDEIKVGEAIRAHDAALTSAAATYASKSEITNVVREVAGKVFDAPLSVTWGLVAENGCFSFVATTNTDTTILGE